MARLATIKAITGFAVSFQPSLDRGRVTALAALGVEAVRAGRSACFSPLADRLDSLAKADREGRLRERIRHSCRAQPLVVDESGCLAVGSAAANLVFPLANARRERGAMILTSDRGFSQWDQAFRDAMVATALLDRLLRHAAAVQVEGSSHRMRQHAALPPPGPLQRVAERVRPASL